MKKKRKQTASFLIALFCLFSTQGWAEPGVVEPQWSQAPILAKHGFHLGGGGTISAESFLELTQPLSQERFSKIVAAQGTTDPAEIQRLYFEYLGNLTHQGLAILSLRRILDHEAAEMELPPSPSVLRSKYVARAVLFENAVDQGKVRLRKVKPASRNPFGPDPEFEWVPNEDMLSKSLDQLYGWLIETVGDRPVRFHIDWSFTKGGLQRWVQSLRSTDLVWPPLTLGFEKLPESYSEFEAEIASRLLPTHLILRRQEAWRRHLRSPRFRRMTDEAKNVSEQEKQALYHLIRDPYFAVQVRKANTYEVVATGRESGHFVARFRDLLGQRQQVLLTRLFGNEDQERSDSDELRVEILKLREVVPVEIFRRVESEFQASIQAGELEVHLDEARFEHREDQPLSSDESLEARQKRAVFDPLFESVSLFPLYESAGESPDESGISLLLLRSTLTENSGFLSFSDRRVQKSLSAKLVAKRQAFVLRELARDLFDKNPLRIEVDTCTDPSWPCAEVGADRLAKALFPERLMKNSDQVAEISLNLFARVFEGN